MTKVHWIKTGQRGARAEFSDSDLITALLLIKNEPMGRYQLQKSLLLSDSSSKSMLNYCKKVDLLETVSKKGHQLTSKGKKLVKLIDNVIIDHGYCSYNFFPEMDHYYTIISNIENETLHVFSSWKFRDVAVAYGAESIIFLQYKNEFLNFPEKEMELDDYYPDLKLYLSENIILASLPNCYLLFVAAKEIERAQKSAIITSLHSQTKIIEEIREYLI
jgi:hypothetical protein